MVTIHRAHGLRVVIFTDDHEPAPCACIRRWSLPKINLVGPDGGPELVWAEDMKRNEARRAMDVVTKHGQAFLARWREIHG